MPSITVVVVRDDREADLEATLASVREQSHPALEILVEERRAESEDGAYLEMADALARATGELVLFLRAGDRLVSPAALRELLEPAARGVDVVYGHFVATDGEGVEELCLVAEVGDNLTRLDASGFDPRWMRRVPCLQATAFRTSLVRRFGFDPELPWAADFDLHRRLVRAGARYALADAVVALCGREGSWPRYLPLCGPEWLRIAVRHGRSHAARRAFVGSGVVLAQAWEKTLWGWVDRARGRRQRRFGPQPSSSVGGGAERAPALQRLLARGIRAAARGLGSVERWLAARRPAARRTARGAGRPEETYLAELGEGIDFRRPGRPTFVAKLNGISWCEPWGRWSDGPRIEVQFHCLLPRHARVVLEAFASEEISTSPVEVSIGVASARVAFAGEPFRTYSVDLETSGRETKLALAIPLPALPVARLGVEGGDPRRLGLALRKLQILEIPAPPDGAG